MLKMRYMIFGHVTPLVPMSVSQDATGTGAGIMTPMALVSASHDANSIVNGTIAFLKVKTIEIRCNVLLLIMCYHWHWCQHHGMPPTLVLVLCDRIGIGIGVLLCQQHHQ